VIADKEDNGTSNGDKHAVTIEAGDTLSAESSHDPAANNGSRNSQNDIEEEAFSLVVDQLAGDKSRD